MKRIFNEITYRIVYGTAYTVSLLPMRVLYAFSSIAYIFTYYIFSYRKMVVTQNISRSFPEKRYEEIQHIIQKFYQVFTDYFMEILKTFSISSQDMKKKVVLINFEWVEAQVHQGKNVIACLGHCGNWEMLNILPRTLSVDTYAGYKPLKNPVLNRITYKLRSRFGMKLIPAKSLAKHILSKKHPCGIYLFLADQCPRNVDEQYRMQFLNQSSAMFPGAEKIARASNSVIIYLYISTISRGHYQVEAIPLFTETKDTFETKITQKYIHVLEKNIQEEPSGWLWSHKRWKR